MKTVKKSGNGKVIMTQRVAGLAISIWSSHWNKAARAYVMGWDTVATGLTRREADAKFAELASA